jgi:endonuclease G
MSNISFSLAQNPNDKLKVPLSFAAFPPYKGIGFVYLNQAGHKALDSYAMSIDDIEEMTGYYFFPSLIESQEKAIESEYDISIWE